MSWYYFKGEEKIGPITKEQVETLVKNGVISANTKIWNDKTQDWKTYEEAAAEIEKTEKPPDETEKSKPQTEKKEQKPQIKTILCDTCGLVFPEKRMAEVGEKKLCEDCKREYFKEIKASFNFSKSLPYGSFFIRFVAKIIDFLVFGLIHAVLSFLFSLIGVTGLFVLLLFTLASSAYYIYFVGTYGATLGKMVLGLEIIIPDGTAVDYKVATFRLLAEGLSSLGLCFGYFMAIFDEEKRTLHDRICNTRVVFR